MAKILVTGASGFVGRGLCDALHARDMYFVPAVRVAKSSTQFAVGELNAATDWEYALAKCEVVIHLAARVHLMKDVAFDPLTKFRLVNVQGTLNLARQAAATGVRRFIFISSIGVNGAETSRRPFDAQDVVAPHSAYAVSKFEAELGLQALGIETGMEIVIIRPPLVYGANAPGNFGSLMQWLRRGVPLPLGAIHNQRSFVALENLVDLIITCVTHPAAARQTFLVSDGEDISTTDLLRRMGRAMNHPAHLIPIPVRFLELAAAMIGKQEVVRRLCGSLQVDIEKTRRVLDWRPPLTLDQGLKKAAEGFDT